MTLVMVGGMVLLLGVVVVILRAVNRIDDVYNRIPHDRDLQELFRSDCRKSDGLKHSCFEIRNKSAQRVEVVD